MSIRESVLLAAATMASVWAAACSDGRSPVPGDAVADRTGYVVLDQIDYWLGGAYTADEARIFYTFQAARERPAEKPVLVLFNGGPGAATTSNLFAMNTANHTLCKISVPDGALNRPNEHAWTDLANLLYIDAPNTGFSYTQDVHDHPCAWGALDTYWTGRNFNPLIDAAQTVRAVLRAMKEAGVQRHKAVIVGESYGGVRAAAVLHMLLYYDASPVLGGWFEDPGLRQEIQGHWNAVFRAGNRVVGPETVAEQFGHAILIQPQLAGGYHNELTRDALCPPFGEGLLDRAAREEGIDGGRFPRCADRPCTTYPGKYLTAECLAACATNNDLAWASLWMAYNDHDPYHYGRPASFSDDLDAFAIRSLTSPAELGRVLGLPGRDMRHFPAAIIRRDARSYHLANLSPFAVPDGALTEEAYQALGEGGLKYLFANLGKTDNLGARPSGLDDYYGPPPNCQPDRPCCDSYYKSWDMMICLANYLVPDTSPDHPRYGRMFLYDLAVLKDVMITNAAWDRIIYSPTLPGSFEPYPEVSGVEVDAEARAFTIQFREGALDGLEVPPVGRRTVAWPQYPESGHAVSVTEPGKLRGDVRAFLKRNGLIP